MLRPVSITPQTLLPTIIQHILKCLHANVQNRRAGLPLPDALPAGFALEEDWGPADGGAGGGDSDDDAGDAGEGAYDGADGMGDDYGYGEGACVRQWREAAQLQRLKLHTCADWIIYGPHFIRYAHGLITSARCAGYMGADSLEALVAGGAARAAAVAAAGAGAVAASGDMSYEDLCRWAAAILD